MANEPLQSSHTDAARITMTDPTLPKPSVPKPKFPLDPPAPPPPPGPIESQAVHLGPQQINFSALSESGVHIHAAGDAAPDTPGVHSIESAPFMELTSRVSQKSASLLGNEQAF